MSRIIDNERMQKEVSPIHAKLLLSVYCPWNRNMPNRVLYLSIRG